MNINFSTFYTQSVKEEFTITKKSCWTQQKLLLKLKSEGGSDKEKFRLIFRCFVFFSHYLEKIGEIRHKNKSQHIIVLDWLIIVSVVVYICLDKHELEFQALTRKTSCASLPPIQHNRINLLRIGSLVSCDLHCKVQMFLCN